MQHVDETWSDETTKPTCPQIQVIHFFIHLQQQKSHGKADSSNYVIACRCVVSTIKKYHCNDNNLPKLSFMEFKANKLRPDAFNNPLPSIHTVKYWTTRLKIPTIAGRSTSSYADSFAALVSLVECGTLTIPVANQMSPFHVIFKYLVRYTAPISFRTRRSCPVPQRPSNPQKFNKRLTCHVNCERGAKCSWNSSSWRRLLDVTLDLPLRYDNPLRSLSFDNSFNIFNWKENTGGKHGN